MQKKELSPSEWTLADLSPSMQRAIKALPPTRPTQVVKLQGNASGLLKPYTPPRVWPLAQETVERICAEIIRPQLEAQWVPLGGLAAAGLKEQQIRVYRPEPHQILDMHIPSEMQQR